MKADERMSALIKRARPMFRRMPEQVLRYIVRAVCKNKNVPDKIIGVSHSPTNTVWDDVCAPFSTLEVAWMKWSNEKIDICEDVLDDSTLANISYVVRETYSGHAPLNNYCQQRFKEYCEFVEINHTIPGDALIAFKVGSRYKLLNGHLRIAAAFSIGQSIFSADALVGVVPDVEEQRKELISAVSDAQRIVSDTEASEQCMCPGCEEIAIGSHSQQEHGQLDNLAEDNFVYALDRNHVDQLAPYFFRGEDCLPHLVKQQIASATVFPGYCNAHDTSVFRCIERDNLVKDTPEQVLAFHIRGLSYPWARQRHELKFSAKVWEIMAEKIGCLVINPQIIHWGIYLPADYEMLIKPCFMDGAVNDLRWVWRIIDKNIGVSCASIITPMDDQLADKLIGDATDYKKGQLKRPRFFASLNVVPLADRTHVVVAWHKDIDSLAKEFTQKLASTNIDVFQAALNEAIFDKSEDYTVAPSLWESMTDEERRVFEVAIVPEHFRGGMNVMPQLINLNGCHVV